MRVDPNGPASKAGLQTGDIILRLDDHNIESSKDLPMMVGSMQPGAKIKLTVWRKGQQRTVQATLGELAQDPTPAANQQQEAMPQNYQFGKLGLTVTELSANQKTELGIRGGLLVQKASGIAARSGLMHGDVILGLNQTEITSIA
nr:PDZ domain-containing protein [Paludibacterium denitrificans]